MHHYNDDQPQQRPLPALRDRPPRHHYVQARCPYCPQAVIVGLDAKHAADLLSIHQEAACPGPRGGDQA
jgi:hypothetical protein